MKRGLIITFLVILIFLAGLLVQRYLFSPYQNFDISSEKTNSQGKVLYWVAPMNPSFRSDKPGKSPMGMDLMPVYADSAKTEKGVVKINPSVVNNLGVTTAAVKKENMYRIINTVGYVSVDERSIDNVHIYTNGWIKKLVVETTGATVKKGELLMQIYSPTMINAQEEFIFALKEKNQRLMKASEQKLITLGMTQQQIKKLSQTKKISKTFNVYANKAGIISKLNAREGMYVKPEVDLMTIDDLSHIWVIAEIFERQASWVALNQVATASLPYETDKLWQGNVDFIYPELDAKTHTLRVRLSFPNPDLSLKPNMYANVKIYSKPLKNVLTIPLPALIQRGEGNHVILALGNGRFKTQAVQSGEESAGRIEIISGLKVGQRVVTSGEFLIDSESSINAEFKRMDLQSKKGALNGKKEYIGMGTVIAIDKQNHALLLDHMPIEKLNMEAMKMEIPVEKGIDINTVKVKDYIHFIIIKNNGGQYLITKIHPVKDKQ